MHETKLVTDVLNQAIGAAAKEGASRIQILRLNYVTTSHVSPETVEALFRPLSQGTIAAGARLVFTPVDQTFHCVNCDRDYRATGIDDACPDCRHTGIPLGVEPDLMLESIEVDEGRD